jgi:hypothetical protein
MNRLRQKIESIVFAGLKPSTGARNVEAPPAGAFARLRARFDRLLAGGPTSDPLYLSNRTWQQKLRVWTILGLPLLLLAGGMGLALSRYLGPPKVVRQAAPSPAELVRALPNFKDLKLQTNRELDVIEVRVDRANGAKMVGQVKNMTDRHIGRAEIGCDLTDRDGAQLGSAQVIVENIPPSGTKRFEVGLKQSTAAFVLVREIATR